MQSSSIYWRRYWVERVRNQRAVAPYQSLRNVEGQRGGHPFVIDFKNNWSYKYSRHLNREDQSWEADKFTLR